MASQTQLVCRRLTSENRQELVPPQRLAPCQLALKPVLVVMWELGIGLRVPSTELAIGLGDMYGASGQATNCNASRRQYLPVLALKLQRHCSAFDEGTPRVGVAPNKVPYRSALPFLSLPRLCNPLLQLALPTCEVVVANLGHAVHQSLSRMQTGSHSHRFEPQVSCSKLRSSKYFGFQTQLSNIGALHHKPPVAKGTLFFF